MTQLFQHVRWSARKLLRSPLFTVTAVLTLALGIGANTAIFSVVHGVLLRPLPFEDAEELLGMWHRAPGLGFDILNQSPATYFTYREDTQALEDVALWDNTQVSVTGAGEPEQLDALLVTDGFFPVLRVQPAIGRVFTAEDDAPGAAGTILVSHAYWQRTTGGDPSILGSTLTVDGRPAEVIGVLPAEFRFLRNDPDIVFPARFDPAEIFFGNFSYQAIGRLAPGESLERVSAEVERLIPVAVERYPGPIGMSMLQQAEFGPVIRPLKEDVVGDVRSVLWVLLGTVGMVLLIACANVANLFLVRAEGRIRDVALRTSLGAGRGQIAAQFLTESLLLGLAGGVVGLALAWGALRLLLSMAPGNLPRLDEIGLDPVVLAFTLVVSVVAGLLFGLFPLLRYGRPNLVTSLKEGGRGGSGRERHRARHALVVAQVGLALVLLVGSGLMIRSFQALRNVDPGFDRPEEVLTFRITIPTAVVEDDAEAALAHEQILRGLRAIPGVASVGGSFSVTMDGADSNDALYVEEFPTPEGELPPVRRFKWIMPGYFETMGNPVVAGRDLEWSDIYDRSPVLLVTENLAREYWGEPTAALGKRMGILSLEEGQETVWREIVGVVGDIHDDGLDQPAVATAFWPIAQDGWYVSEGVSVQRSIAYAVRAGPGGLTGLFPRAREAVWAVNPNLPLANVRTLEEILERSLSRTSFTLAMLGIAGAVALLLGMVGIYGVISYAVSQRTREIGVRMALGAQRFDVRRMVVQEGLVLTGLGIVLGLAVALGLTRMMSSLLFGVGAMDPLTYGTVAIGLGAVALVASYLPASRASRLDPAVTLRQE